MLPSLQDIDALSPNNDTVLAKTRFKRGAIMSPPSAIEPWAHDFKDKYIIALRFSLFFPKALRRGARKGGQAAKRFGELPTNF